MRKSLSMRAAAASAVALLLFSCGLTAALAHGQGSFGGAGMRPGFAHGRGFAPGFHNAGRQPWNWRGPYAANRFGRNGRFWNRGGFYGGFYGGGFYYPPYTYGGPGPDFGGGGGGGLIIAVGGPSASNYPAAFAESPDPGGEGPCVIHHLIYDSSGQYVGERRTAGC